jgi:regulator of protease activity HflC (stomatin/prohibitin superfamily)
MRVALFAIVLVAPAACATVPSGHSGVVLRASGVDEKPLPEGVSYVGPLAEVQTYDLRSQQRSEDFDALSADGLPLEAHASVLTFHPVASELVALAREIGPKYYEVLVKPVVRSSLRRVLAAYRADALDISGSIQAEKRVTEDVAQRLRPRHIVFDSISLRTLTIPLSSRAYREVLANQTIVEPVLRSEARRVFGRYTPEEIYSTKRDLIEREIREGLRSKIDGKHIALEAVLIRNVELPDPIRQAIDQKLAAEQEVLKMKYVIEVAKAAAEQRKIEAQGIADYNQTVAASLSSPMLEFDRIQELNRLATSSNSKTVVLGPGAGSAPVLLSTPAAASH